MSDEIDAMLGEEEKNIDREEARELREKKIKRTRGSPDAEEEALPDLEPAELMPVSHEEKRTIEETIIGEKAAGKKKAKAGKREEKKGAKGEEIDEETKKAILERIRQIIISRGRGAAARDELRRLLAGAPGGFNAAMGEILKKYAHVLDTGGGLEPSEKIQSQPVQGQVFAPYAEKGRKEGPGLYAGAGKAKEGPYSGKERMEGETYRQTKAADVDAEKAFERMTHGYHGTHEDKKRGKSIYAHD